MTNNGPYAKIRAGQIVATIWEKENAEKGYSTYNTMDRDWETLFLFFIVAIKTRM